MTSLVAVVPAWNEGDRIEATVEGLGAIAKVEEVLVVDNGSNDDTASRAAHAGARVLRMDRNVGKGRAIEVALEATDPATQALRVRSRRVRPSHYLLADGDLGSSARELGALVDVALHREVDLAIAAPPPPPTGGFGLVRRAGTALVHAVGGPRLRHPLSGQRVATAECLHACRPLAEGFGVDAAMVADAGRLGFRIAEVPVKVTHRFTRRDAAGFRHRGRQGLDLLRAMAPRLAGVR